MPFDSATYPAGSTPALIPAARLVDTVQDLCPDWAALNPDRALALLFVEPRDCAAVDELTAL